MVNGRESWLFPGQKVRVIDLQRPCNRAGLSVRAQPQPPRVRSIVAGAGAVKENQTESRRRPAGQTGPRACEVFQLSVPAPLRLKASSTYSEAVE